MTINTVNLVYEQQLLDEAARAHRRSLRHYPSGACAVVGGKFIGKCRRATWFDWMGAERTNPPDAPALFKMAVGDLIHDHLDRALDRALERLGWAPEEYSGRDGSVAEGIGDEAAFVWQPEGLKYPFSGRLDKRFVKEGRRLAAEWKSTYGRGSDDVKANGPKEDALLQCACYLRQDSFPVDEVVLMYAARDTGYLQGFSVTEDPRGLQVESMNSSKVLVSPISWGAVHEATRQLEDALGNEASPPPRDYGPGNPDRSTAWRCNYCSYLDVCGKMQ